MKRMCKDSGNKPNSGVISSLIPREKSQSDIQNIKYPGKLNDKQNSSTFATNIKWSTLTIAF